MKEPDESRAQRDVDASQEPKETLEDLDVSDEEGADVGGGDVPGKIEYPNPKWRRSGVLANRQDLV